jgi:hypothetical protein
MANFPKDRFDDLPADLTRVGAHRGPQKKGRGWIGFAWALLATGILVFGGLFGISRVLDIDLGLPFIPVEVTPTPTPTPTPTAEPLTDPTTIAPERLITITVLNGTEQVGLENTVGTALTAAGWPITATATTAEPNVEETFVYYTDPANEDVARGVAVALGVGGIRLVEPGTISSAPITVVLGADYEAAPPAG